MPIFFSAKKCDQHANGITFKYLKGPFTSLQTKRTLVIILTFVVRWIVLGFGIFFDV